MKYVKVWLAISGAKEKMAENQPMYKKLCEIVTAAPNPSVDMQQIEKVFCSFLLYSLD